MGQKCVENISDLKLMYPDEIKAYLDQYIIGQDKAKKTLSVAVYNHYKKIMFNQTHGNSNINLDKSNCLILGPTGSGKTFMIQKIAELLKIPMTIIDSNSITQSGYVGSDVEDCIVGLLRASDYNMKATEIGIVVLDEVDKLKKVGVGTSITRDVGGEGTQQALLKMIEGSIVGCPPAGGRKHPEQSLLYVDTKNIMFIGLGAFVGIENIVKGRINESHIGFNANNIKLNEDDYIDNVTPQDLRDYGMIPEFIGRFPIITNVKKLPEDALVNVLVEPKNSLVKQYQELFRMDGIDLSFDDSALKEIAKIAFTLGTGVRGLRSVIETVMMEAMFNIRSLVADGKTEYTVTKEFVKNNFSKKTKKAA